MDRRLASSIYDVLVAECGALERSRADFVLAWPRRPEFRFGGWLGAGGKVVWAAGRATVEFYRSDPTDPEYSTAGAREATLARRRRMATRANGMIDSLVATHRAVEPPVLVWSDMPWQQLTVEQIDPILALIVEQASKVRVASRAEPDAKLVCRIPYRPWREIRYLRGDRELQSWAEAHNIEVEVL